MSLQMPNLDDRSFDDLLAEALNRIGDDLETSWNDFSPGDPGVILLEAFSFLTEQMIYRLNRLPEKAYIAFLRMLGVGLRPPYAAHVVLSFYQDPTSDGIVQVKKGMQVSSQTKGGEPVIFTTIADLDVPPESCSEETASTVIAYHTTWVEEDLPVRTTRQPGQVFSVAQPPVLAGVSGLEMKLGIEVKPEEERSSDWITADGRHFQVWDEVDNFVGCSPESRVYRMDRQAGLIQFAPAAYLYTEVELKTLSEATAVTLTDPNKKNGHNGSGLKTVEIEGKTLAAIPPEDRVVHVRYPTGGGAGGNIPARLLVEIQEPADLKAKVKVINREAARGGVDTEPLENALVRGPQEVFTQERLVTARDFERKVLREWHDIARARAYSLQDLWEHGQPGSVSIKLVPALRAPDYPGPETYTKEALESEQARLDADLMMKAVEKKVEEKSTLGIRTRLGWTRYKRVWVSADVKVPPGEDTVQIQERLKKMLHRAISPLPPPPLKETGAPANGKKQAQELNGWSYGAELRLAEVSRWIFTSEEKVRLMPVLELKIESAPDKEIASLAPDPHQPNTWYAASGTRLFRTTNNATGWEELLDFTRVKSNLGLHLAENMEVPEKHIITRVCPCPDRAGMVAISAVDEAADPQRSYIYLSFDCGENWTRLCDDALAVQDMDWLLRTGRHILLLATSQGLKELHIEFNAQNVITQTEVIPIAVTKDAANKTAPVNAVKVLRGHGGKTRVAVAMDMRGGIYLSEGIELSGDSSGTMFKELETGWQEHLPKAADIRCLGVQWHEQANRFLLWAGSMAIGPDDPGEGCCRWVFDEFLVQETNGSWFKAGWGGGSCLGLAFLGSRVLAATAHNAVLYADVQSFEDAPDGNIAPWKPFTDRDKILPKRKERIEGLIRPPDVQIREAYIPFTAVAASIEQNLPVVLAGCDDGVFRSTDQGETFEKVSRDTFRQMKDSVTIPPDWLLVSGEHDIRVVVDDSQGYASSTASGME